MTHRMVLKPAPDRPGLSELLRKATATPMTLEQEREQRISFVYGNVGMSNPDVTRKMVADAVDGKRGEGPGEDSVYASGGLTTNTGTYIVGERPSEFPAFLAPRLGDWMQTYTGRQAWPMDMRADEVFIEDVAHSLAMQCRYAGHSLRFYSVAEHSVLMARWFRAQGMAEYALPALLHDATEAYLVDVPRPVKPFLPGYKEAEHRAWLAIAERLGLDPVLSSHVHDADNRILGDERAQNMSTCVAEWHTTGAGLGVTLQFWTPEQAEAEFLATYWSIIETGRM